MSVERVSNNGHAVQSRPSTVLRLERKELVPIGLSDLFTAWRPRFAVLIALASGFVLIGGGNLDPGPNEARLGLAAFEKMGPFGQVFGGWEPAVLPAQLLPSLIWAWGEGGTPSPASLRWPAAIAGVIAGLILARRTSTSISGRAGVLAGLAWYGSIALMDRSETAGIDLITGLFVIASLDRILGRGSDLVAGAWAGLAFLAGGWPPLAVIGLATIVIGRPSATLSTRFLFPPTLVAVVWAIWALRVTPAEALAAALSLPLVQKPAWFLAPGVLFVGLPWTPFAALTLSRTIRSDCSETAWLHWKGWLQVAGASLLAGTVVPGLADAARIPALAGLAIAAAAGLEQLFSATQSMTAPRRWFFAVIVVQTLLWSTVVLLGGGYLAAAVPFYRSLVITLAVFSVPTTGLAIYSAMKSAHRPAFLAVFLLAALLKLAHWGYYVPEWNYRLSQGPWGRAVGQWIPPRWPIYTTHRWRTELAFATEHPVYQLVSPIHLGYQPGEARFVLLLGSEFENWPKNAPKIDEVARFQDEYGSTRVLARTPGPLPWTRPIRDE